jgi:murein DD-endopeptidase MepM/ murein hydrolase activator NlpD
MASYKSLAIAIKTALLERFPRGHLIAIAVAVPVLAISAFLPSGSDQDDLTTLELPAHQSTTTLVLPSLDGSLPKSEPLITSVSAAPLALPPNIETPTLISAPNSSPATKPQTTKPSTPNVREFIVQSGDSLSLLFRRAGLSDKDIYELFNSSSEAKQLRSIRPGQKLAFTLNNNNKLQDLTYFANQLEHYTFSRQAKGFKSSKVNIQPDVKNGFSHGTIDSSLYLAGKRAGMPSTTTMELATIFAWDIDFAQDIKKGDSFKVMYEEQFLKGKSIGAGKILAAEFINNGKTYRAVRYTDKNGESRYYTPDGRGMQKAFLRSPIEFSRISSHFNLARKHPVLHSVTRPHKGTDYAAARGTPIMAAGDGRVQFVGSQNGYGNTVILTHSGGYKSLYAHMNGFAKGMRKGKSVSQGEIIGYVGSTGLASGPHLHYEFHVNGQVKNPVTVPLPKSVSIDKSQLAHFNATTRPLIAKLSQLADNTQVAMVKSEDQNNN